MDFEALKVIWDSQESEPLYAVNEAALHAVVRRRREAEHRRTAWCYGREIAINAMMALIMLVAAGLLAWGDRDWLASRAWINRPVSSWHVAALAVAAVIWAWCASYMWAARRRQLQRERGLATSLHGELERTLSHIAFQIAIARGIAWWGLLPSWFAAGLGVVTIFHLKAVPLWAYAMMVCAMTAAFAFALACQHGVIVRRYRPRQHELETLRAKLTDAQH